MDILLTKVTQQAMNYAIRSGIAVTSGYAISQCSRLLKTKTGQEKEDIETLQRRLESKIRIISPAIDMIELITARGNTSLESAVSLTKSLRWEIQTLGVQLANAAGEEELSRKRSSRAKSKAQRDENLRRVVADMRKLLDRIEDAVPLINLAITTSGVSLTANLPASVSPSRLLQASTFLSAGDSRFISNSSIPSQIGPTFTLSMYMLFSGHANRAQDEEGLRHTTWKEVMHKARVKLVRTTIENADKFPFGASCADGKPEAGPNSKMEADKESSKIPAAARADEFAYQLMLVEDLNDGRVHTFEDSEMKSGPFDDVDEAGIREIVPIHEISKIFYADTGKILNIGSNDETNNPVLLLKRDLSAAPPRRMIETAHYSFGWDEDEDYLNHEETGYAIDEASELEAQFQRETSVPIPKPLEGHLRLPKGLDPEWIALEVYVEEPQSDSDSETESLPDDADSSLSKPHQLSRENSLDPDLTSALSDLNIENSPSQFGRTQQIAQKPLQPLNSSRGSLSGALVTARGVRTSLSLLEMLIRLTSLQQFQQASHLTITDEMLNFFLEESSTTGAAPGDVDTRKLIRMDARQRVGFDPYDESPIKRRGEKYQNHAGEVYGDDGWDSPRIKSASQREKANSSSHSPLLLRSREYIPKDRSSPLQETSPSSGVKQSNGNLASPSANTKSRESFLRDEALRAEKLPSSPLARSESRSSANMDISDGPSPAK